MRARLLHFLNTNHLREGGPRVAACEIMQAPERRCAREYPCYHTPGMMRDRCSLETPGSVCFYEARLLQVIENHTGKEDSSLQVAWKLCTLHHGNGIIETALKE